MTIEPGTENSIQENGFIVIGNNKNEMAVYHLWGEQNGYTLVLNWPETIGYTFMRRIFIISVFFLFRSLSYSQSGESLLRAKLVNADTVLLVSHEETSGVKVIDDTGKEIPLPKLIVSGKPNYQIVRERQVVKVKQLDTLIQILTRPFRKTEIEMGHCFIPHQAIFILKDGNTSYVDLCFHCLTFETSKDLKELYAMDDLKWSELYNFFLKLGFKYQMPGFEK